MPFTDDGNLEIPTAGVADWDSPLSSNFSILATGLRFKATAGSAINTGDAVCVLTSGFAVPYDASSRDAPRPRGLAESAMGSGDANQFLYMGVSRSMTVFSGNINVGERVFVDPASPGMLTSSYTAARFPVGIGLAVNAVLFKPESYLPEKVTDTVSVGPLIVGSAHAFEIDLGQRGTISWLEGISGTSSMAYKLQFFSGSARVGSEELYETVTTSVDGGASDYDVNTGNYLDRSVWAYRNTDVASPGLVFGLITVQSISATATGNFSFYLEADRYE